MKNMTLPSMKQAQKMQAQNGAGAAGAWATSASRRRRRRHGHRGRQRASELVSIKIDPEIVKAGDIPMLEDLVLAAVNEARSRSEELMRDAMNRVAGPFGGFPFV
jgi:DNA-binding protein YbaB